MNWQTFPFLIPYLVSVIVSILVGLFTWRRRNVVGASAFAWVAFSQAFMTLGYIFELANPSLEDKLFWDDIQWLGVFGWYFSFLAFSLQFTGRKLSNPKRTWGLLVIFPAIFLLLLITNSLHGLIRSDAWLVYGNPISALEYDFTAMVYLIGIYAYILIFTCIILLIQEFRRSHRLYQTQIGIVTVGALMPLIGSMLTLAGVTFTFQRDTTPFSFIFSNLIIAFGLFRYRLFDILPIARNILIDNMSDTVVVLDIQNRIVDINPAALANAGFTASETIGKPANQIFSAFSDLVERFKDIEEISTELFIERGNRQGPQYSDLRIIPLRNNQGVTVGRLAISRDITERKHMEMELKQAKENLEQLVQERSAELYLSEKRYRTVVENANEGIAVIQDGYFKFINPKALEILVYPEEEVMATPFIEFTHPDDRETLIDRARRRLDGEVLTGDFVSRIIDKDGNIRWVERKTETIQWEEKQAILTIATDITERRQADEKLKEYSEHLEEMVEERTQELRDTQDALVRQERLAMLGELAGSVSHELRNPLGVINNAVHYLQAVLPDATQDVNDYLEIISSEVFGSAKIISDLLDFTRVQMADRYEVAATELVGKTLLNHPAPVGIEMINQISLDLPLLYVDSSQIGQVLSNLVANAYQAMPEGGDLTLHARAEDGEVKITVSDNGVGISEENMERLFEPLFTTKARGIGLGLAVSKKLVEINGGRIEVESEEGAGTSFTLALPTREKARKSG